MSISFAANLMVKPKRLIAHDAPESLCHLPRAGQRMIDGGDVVVKEVLVGLVEVDALLNNGLVILMQRDTGGIKDAGTLQASSNAASAGRPSNVAQRAAKMVVG
jgi:hypothetical protein